MDFETFVKSLLSYIKDGDNVYFLVYAVATCLLTQLVKKLFLNKTKVEVMHKFDFAEILPFLFGVVFAVVDMVFIHPVQFSAQFVTQLVITAATIGALATVIFKFVSSLSGKSMKSLLKDDVFGVFYTQLLYCGNLRQQLLKGEMTLENFVSQVKSLSQSASEIYGTQQTAEEKKAQLRQLLENVLGEDADDCVNVLDKALQAFSSEK